MTDGKTSLRSGWSFSRPEGTTTQATQEEIIRQSLWTLLSTEPGERVLHSDYGCSIKQYAFDIFYSVAELLDIRVLTP